MDDSSTYSCAVTATSNSIPIGTSAAVLVDPIPIGQLPPTGAGALPTAGTAAVVALAGIVLVLAAGKPRRARPD